MPTDGLDIFLAAMSFVLGSLIGSFLNVCVHRIPKGRSIIRPGSHCPQCDTAIHWYDNLPMVSWVVLRGHCRHCGASISARYPLIEGLTAVLFLAVFLRHGYDWATPVYMVLTAGLILVTFVDLDDWTIPDEVTLPGIPLGILCSLIPMYLGEDTRLYIENTYTGPFDAIIGAVAGFVSLLLIDGLSRILFKKPGMGMGDMKLLAMLGAFFGWKGDFLVVMCASLIGSVVGLAMVVLKRPAKDLPEEVEGQGGHYLPFGPYLALAGIVLILFGREIFDFYHGFIGSAAMLP